MEILQEKYSEKHNDSVWYDGWIARIVKENGTELVLIAAGDIRIYNKEGELVYDGKERNSGIKGGFENDDDLKKIGYDYDDDYRWENNNWFEVMFKKKGEKYFDGIMGDVAHEYDSAIEMLKAYEEDDRF